jgi:hypothetical protein
LKHHSVTQWLTYIRKDYQEAGRYMIIFAPEVGQIRKYLSKVETDMTMKLLNVEASFLE